MKNLPDPYGDCEDLDPVPVSECRLDFKTERVVDACGCHDVYMRPVTNDNGEESRGVHPRRRGGHRRIHPENGVPSVRTSPGCD